MFVFLYCSDIAFRSVVMIVINTGDLVLLSSVVMMRLSALVMVFSHITRCNKSKAHNKNLPLPDPRQRGHT
jgi:hypothetical protein